VRWSEDSIIEPRKLGDQRAADMPTLGDFVAARDPATNSATFDAAYSQRIPNELY
jgi:hypothetical protein